MIQISQSVFGRITAVVTACSLMFLGTAIPIRAETSDYPEVRAVGVGLAVGVEAGSTVYPITKEVAPSPNAPKVKAWGQTLLYLRDGTRSLAEGYVEAYSRSIGLYRLPDSIPDLLPLPPSFVIAEKGTVEGTLSNQFLLDFDSIDVEANVMDAALNNTGKYVAYDVVRTGTATWTRPVTAVGDGLVTIGIIIHNLIITTTSVPQTTGTAGYELEISSPELGIEPIFYAQGHVLQDGSLTTRGDIPAGAYVTVPGGGEASLTYADTLTTTVPQSLSSITLNIEFRTRGSGMWVPDGPPIPTLPEWGLIILTISAFLGVVWTVTRRRRGWQPV